MSDINNGGPAFPVQNAAAWQAHGMTLRDYFAAKAMQATLPGARLPGLLDGDASSVAALALIARCSYLVADAMLKAREASK